MRASRLLPTVLVLLVAAVAAACGEEDGGEPPATPTIAGDETATPVAPAVRGPAQFLYTVGEGDTIAAIAATFGVGEDVVRAANRLNGEPTAGAMLKVPLVGSGAGSMVPAAGLEAALGPDGPALLQPSLELQQGYVGRVALYAVKLADGVPAGEGYGYVMEYRETDRAAFRAGAIDPEARFAGPAFTIAAGSLAGTIEAGSEESEYRFERGGFAYVVVAAAAAPLPAGEIAGMLELAAGE